MFVRLVLKSFLICKSRFLAAFLAFAIGTAMISGLLNLYYDVSIKVTGELRRLGPNFLIVPRQTGQDQMLGQEVVSYLKKTILDGKLAAVSPLLYGVVRLDLGEAVLAGADLAQLKRLNPLWEIKGDWIGVDFDIRNCLIGEALAEEMEIKLGDSVTVLNQRSGFQTKVKIKGILKTGTDADARLWVNLPLAQKVLGLEGKAHEIMVQLLSDSRSADLLKSSLESEFPDVDANSIKKLSDAEGEVLEKIKSLMVLILFVITCLMGLCVLTTLVAMIEERDREMALMKAIGGEDRDIYRLIFAEIGVICVLGLFAGQVIGFFTADFLERVIFDSPASLRIIVVPISSLVTIVLAFLSTLTPLRMVTRIVPAEILKTE